jgi:predicted CoA-substrate-specific enzyme activase
MAATGIFSERLTKPILAQVPEETAQEIATITLHARDKPINVLRLGGRGYSILTLDQEGRVRFEENDKCSSGTGETVEKVCHRLGLELQDAIRLAEGASESISISARCSVFAKSEITHFANQGEPHDRLVLGYFESVARNLYSLYERYKTAGPVLLIGNGALIGPVTEAFARICPVPARVSPFAPVYEALGAMHLAAEKALDKGHGITALQDWPADPMSLIATKSKRISRLQPASRAAAKVVHLHDDRVAVSPAAPAVMGIDLGSTGSKAALVDLASGAVIADLYRGTDGNPVEAAKALVAGLAQMAKNPVQAIGLTGSGRYAVATVFCAAYNQDKARIFVENEILAHAQAAIARDERRGESLSIVEIGGQDAKFINVEDGRVVESDMNRACSAGTGSFLEEQARLYGLENIAAFGPMAERSVSPPDLGQMCTVFVADLASEALREGYKLEDLCAGFQYSVITNYKNRVMGNRRFLERIFFQGKPACSPSLAQTLAAVTGREVVVPPNPGAMGAIGIALMARELLPGLKDARPLDLETILRASITSRKTARCLDKTCGNLCRIESASVAVANEHRIVVSGGRCPKYEEASAGRKKLPMGAPDPYREREDLLARFLRDSDSEVNRSGSNSGVKARSVSLLYGQHMLELAPFFYTFFRETGLSPHLVRSDNETLPRGDRRCSASGACASVKIMHGLAETSTDILFLPRIVDAPRAVARAGVSTCTMTQAVPQMIEEALRAEGARVRIEWPAFHLADGLGHPKFAWDLKRLFNRLGECLPNGKSGLVSFYTAYRKALRAQHDYEKGLYDIGRRTLAFAGQHGYPVVLLVGNCHVIHEPILNGGIADIISREGALALPIDCYEIDPAIPPLQRVYWHNASRSLRASIAAAKQGGVFPVLMSSYGCGPGSFLEQLFNDLMEGYPHTVLESDGHGGQAGYITRVQAFMHAARSYRGGNTFARSNEKLLSYDRFPLRTRDQMRSSKISVLTVGPNLGRHITACLQARGYRAEFAGLTDAVGFKLGRQSCTGKECIPYQLIWGSFMKHLSEHPPEPGSKNLLLNVSGCGPCRNGMFPLANEISLRSMGLADRVQPLTFGSLWNHLSLYGEILCAAIITDLLNNMRFHYRAVEKHAGDADRLFNEYSDKAETLFRRKGVSPMLSLLGPLAFSQALVVEAARAFLALPIDRERGQQARTVFLSGDIYLRVDEWGNDELARKLNRHGLYVVLQPFVELLQYVILVKSRDLAEIDNRQPLNRILLVGGMLLNRWLYGAVSPILPFIKATDVRAVKRESRPLLEHFPLSESQIAIGSTLLAWREIRTDGAVVVGPWGCGPALISEAQLRRRPDIPMLFIYNDGDPIDDAKMAGFAWRLKRKPSRLRA